MMSGGYYGLRVYYCNNLDVYHNTAVGSYAGLYDYYNGATVDIRNSAVASAIVVAPPKKTPQESRPRKQ